MFVNIVLSFFFVARDFDAKDDGCHGGDDNDDDDDDNRDVVGDCELGEGLREGQGIWDRWEPDAGKVQEGRHRSG